MVPEIKTLKCLDKTPHQAHDWTFKWDRPETDYHCPGISETKEK